MANLQKLGAASAFIEAGSYLALFLFFGAFWQYPVDAAASEKMAYLSDHATTLQAINLLGYVLFGIALAVVVQAVHERIKAGAPQLSRFAAGFGYLWVGLVIAAGMIANIGISAVVKQAGSEPEQALITLQLINLIVEGIGGGNEVVGGLWVLLLSIAAMPKTLSKGLPKSLCLFGMLVGLAGLATIYPADVFTEIFGITQIIWFVWLGVALLREP